MTVPTKDIEIMEAVLGFSLECNGEGTCAFLKKVDLQRAIKSFHIFYLKSDIKSDKFGKIN